MKNTLHTTNPPPHRADAELVAQVAGLNKVLLSESPALAHELAENISAALASIAKDGDYTHVVAPSSALGKSVALRVGALLDSQPLSDISAVQSEDTFQRGTYAGNVVTEVKVHDAIKVLSVRAASFEKAETGGPPTRPPHAAATAKAEKKAKKAKKRESEGGDEKPAKKAEKAKKYKKEKQGHLPG